MFPLFFWRTVETEVTPNWCWLNSAIVLHLPFNLLSIYTIFHHFLADFRNYSCCCCRYSCDSGRGCSCCCCCWLMRGTNLDLAGSDSGGVHRSGLAQQTIQLSPQFVKCFVLFSSGINECRGTNLFRWWLEAFCRLVRSVTITNRPNCVFGWTVSDATTTLPPFHRSTVPPMALPLPSGCRHSRGDCVSIYMENSRNLGRNPLNWIPSWFCLCGWTPLLPRLRRISISIRFPGNINCKNKF